MRDLVCPGVEKFKILLQYCVFSYCNLSSSLSLLSGLDLCFNSNTEAFVSIPYRKIIPTYYYSFRFNVLGLVAFIQTERRIGVNMLNTYSCRLNMGYHRLVIL